MSKLYAFTELPNATAGATFAASGAPIMRGHNRVDGKVYIATRGDRVCVAVSCENAELASLARHGQMAPKADVHKAGGCTIVDSVWLTFDHSSSAWVQGQHRDDMSEDCRAWQPHILLATMRAEHRRPLTIPPAARRAGDEVCRLELTGEITSQSVSGLVCSVQRARGQTIHLSINSPGGEIAAGNRLYRTLAAHDCLVMTHASVQASSAAAVVFMAGDVRSMDSDASLMVHRPHISELDQAKSEDLRAMADQLDRTAKEMAAIVAARSGVDVDIVQEWVNAETYFGAGEALSVGMVHHICHDQAPLIPQARRVRTAPINGPYQSARRGGSASPQLLELGRVYDRDTRVRFNGGIFRAKSKAFGALGVLAPDLDKVLWERVL